MGCKISLAKSGSLYFGDRFKMSAESSIAACNSIVFGDNCLISWDTLVMDSDFHKIFDENGLEINAPQEVVIGDNVWIGCRCLILKGAKIPSGSIIAASSVVNAKELHGQNTIFGGQPVKELRKNVRWKH